MMLVVSIFFGNDFLSFNEFHVWFYERPFLTHPKESLKFQFFFREKQFFWISTDHRLLFSAPALFKVFWTFTVAPHAKDKDN